MERRNWSLEVLNKLIYIDSLDDEDRALALEKWADSYILDTFLDDIDLEPNDFKILCELFYKNIEFLKKYQKNIKIELNRTKDIKKFLQ